MLQNLIIVADALGRLLGRHAEIVVHDLPSGTIVHLVNGFSHRRVGDPSLTDLAELPTTDPVIGPYVKTTADGRRLRSVTAVIRDSSNAPSALLCVNQDIEPFLRASDALQELLESPIPLKPASALFGSDWREGVNERVAAFLAGRGVALTALRAEEQDMLIRALDEAGVFAIRGAAPHVAAVLGMSRATLYARLKRTRAVAREPLAESTDA